MKNNIHLIQIQYRAVDLPEINWRPDVLSKLNGATKTAIENAFKKNAIIDSTGCVWISIEGIRSILRLGTASKAPIIFASLKLVY